MMTLVFMIIAFGVDIWLGWHIGKQYGSYVGWFAFLTLQTLDSIYFRVKDKL